MTKYQKEVKKAEKIIKKALSKIEWENQGLSVSGNAEVSGNARVYGNVRVYGNAEVSGDAVITD